MIELAYVIPAYNAERTVLATVEAVLGQRGARVHVVVVDDGSTDGTADAARSTRDWRVEVVRQRNLGLAGARNTGLEVLEDRAKAVCFLDADDTVEREHAAALCGALGIGGGGGPSAGFDAAACGVRMVGAGLEDLGWTVDVLDGDLAPERLIGLNPLAVGAVGLRVEALRERGGERPFVASQGTEDWGLWLRLVASGCRWAPAIREHLFNYRISAGAMSGGVESMWRGGQGVIAGARGYEDGVRERAQRHWTVRHLARAAAGSAGLVEVLLRDLDGRGGRGLDVGDRAAFVGALAHGFMMEHAVGPGAAVEREAEWRRAARRALAGWEESHGAIESLAFGSSEAVAEGLARMVGGRGVREGGRRLVVAGMGRNGRGLARALVARGVGFEWYDDAPDGGPCPVPGAGRIALSGIGGEHLVVVTPASGEELRRRMEGTGAAVVLASAVLRAGEVMGRGVSRRRVA